MDGFTVNRASVVQFGIVLNTCLHFFDVDNDHKLVCSTMFGGAVNPLVWKAVTFTC